MYPLDDTIAAISSPPGGAARGIVRVSGPQTFACLRRWFCEDDAAVVADALPTAVCGSLRLPNMVATLPCELYLWPAGRSYTGGPTAEIHTLGSPPLLRAVLAAFCLSGARPAGPGEFTLRAFLAGRIDLTQAEAVLGVIDAADAGQLDVALTQLAGGLARPLHQLRDTLVDLLAHLEAGFDFADEDLPFITAHQINRQLGEAIDSATYLLRQMASRHDATELIRVVLVGPPNSGKSSLFNALTRDAHALVADRPGTTRDYLTADLDLDGIKFQLIDTAGVDAEYSSIDGSVDGPGNQVPSVNQAAQAAAAKQHRRAQVRIVCFDSTRPCDLRQSAECAVAHTGVEQILVATKIDLGRCDELCEGTLLTSSVTGAGIDALRNQLRRAVLDVAVSGSRTVTGTAVRCRESLRHAVESLQRARKIATSELSEELVAAEIRVALDELAHVVGAVYTDDLLDRVFSRFCVGK